MKPVRLASFATVAALATLATMALATSAVASPEYKCKDNRVEKSGSTKFTVRRSGSDLTIEKSGSTKGKAVKRGSKMAVEVSGSTKATIENGKIYKSGSSWGTVSEAQRQFDCDDNVAATLWVLFKIGVLP
jgi:FKBP-type peptidyl-prolyl cis-trans isomerase